MIALHPQLAQDTQLIGRFTLCQVRILLDANYPWFVLVPNREGVTEIHQLSEADQQQFLRESSFFTCILEKLFVADKFNIAALGNVVPQLHIHHVVRYRTDPAWPAPVWGAVPRLPYTAKDLEERVNAVTTALMENGGQAFTPLIPS